MAAVFTVGQQLGNGATVVSDTFTTLQDGTTVEHMTDSHGGQEVITVPGAGTPGANQITLQQRAQNALATNATFLALSSPTNAQTLAQVQALTKECSALIRLILGQIDTVTGT